MFKFVTKIHHWNVDTEGIIKLEMLENEWKPTNTILGVFESIRSLLKEAKTF